MQELISAFANQKREKIDFSEDVPSSEDDNISIEDVLKENEYLFASMQLQDFANILGLPNSMTCFEYLEQGETDDIIYWDRFIKIPE